MYKAPKPWILLALTLGLFLSYLARMRPADLFGGYHDDAIYFSSAKALAQGEGYVLPSVPGTPRQTKYPVLYPWLLSFIWKWNPAFPSNVSGAVWLSAACACVFLILSFRLVRALGLAEPVALVVVFLCAFQPYFRLLGASVLSDIPFMTLALAAMLFADSALRPGSALLKITGVAVLAGLSVLTRGFGFAVVAGLATAAVWRRAFRQAVVFCLVAAPFVALSLLWPAPQAVARAAAEPAWRQAWLFYTSYGEFWKLNVPDVKTLLAMVAFNTQALLEAPSTYCLTAPLGGQASYARIMLSITLTAGIFAGVIRQARAHEWKPMHFVFGFYAAMLLLWNYPIMNRFLMLFLPMFFAGTWLEGRHLARSLRDTIHSGRPNAEKIVAGMLALGMVALAALTVREYSGWLRPPGAPRAESIAKEKEQVYAWIRQNTDPTARFIAYEDVSLYLYTGRQAMRPLVFSTAAFYLRDEQILERDLTRFTDVARHIGARYWVAAEDDFHLETGLSLIEMRVDEWKTSFPVVFRSDQNRVQVYDLSSLQPSRVSAL